MIKDSMQLSNFNTIKFPKLKGHIKLTLHNVHNGKNEVYEGENIVTNAVSDIMSANYMGGIDYSNVFGTSGIWKKWYGGVLAYETAHANLDADKYFPLSETHNHLVAHAGQNPIDANHDDDMRRGSPTPSSFVEDETSIKQVWEWGTTHGNGNISALSLCHTDVGDAGLGSAHYAFQNFSPFDLIQGSQLPNSTINLVQPDNLMAQYDDNHGLFFHIGEPEDWAIGNWCASMETTKITVCIRRLPYAKSGLFETLHARSGQDRTFTVTITGVSHFSKIYAMPSFYFDYTTKKLWLFTNNTGVMRYSGVSWDKKHIYCIVIDCENEEIDDEFEITSDTENIVPLCEMTDTESTGHTTRDNCYMIANLVKEGDYVYFPTGTGTTSRLYSYNFGITGYKKIKTNSSGQTSISFASGVSDTLLKSAIKQGGLIITSGIVINDTGYACQSQFSTSYDKYTFGGVWCYQEPTKPSSLVLPLGAGNSTSISSTNRYIAANKLLNTTKYNLPSTVQKTASQSMMIEYTLTEVEPEEEE